MRSLFSCFLRKRKKSDEYNKEKILDGNITNHVKLDNECKIECNVILTNTTEKLLEAEIKVGVTEEESETETKLLIERMRIALMRIENVNSILRAPSGMYKLSVIIEDLENIQITKLRIMKKESELVTEDVIHRSDLLIGLFSVQLAVLKTIEIRAYTNIDEMVAEYIRIATDINKNCDKSRPNALIYRLVADAALMFAWPFILEGPALLVQGVLDGAMVASRAVLDDPQHGRYSAWLRAMMGVLSDISAVIGRHLRRNALVWGIDGPVPTNAFQALVILNYSNNTSDRRIVQPKIVRTTAPEQISCDDMRNLMDSLRSGEQRARLRPVRKEAELNTIEQENDESNTAANEVVGEVELSTVSEQLVAVASRQRYGDIWIIENEKNVMDDNVIDVDCRDGAGAVIRHCQDMSVQISGKAQSVSIEDCSNVNVIVDDVNGLCVASKCRRLDCQVFGVIRTVKLQNVDGMRLFVSATTADQLDLATQKCSDVELFVSKDADGGLEIEDYVRHVVASSCRSTIIDQSRLASVAVA